jgi:hypothetical protein
MRSDDGCAPEAADIDQDENVTAPFTQSTVEAAALTGLIFDQRAGHPP